MKRIFALVLSLVFLLSCLVLPAGAMFDPSPVYQVQAASAYIVNTDTNIIVYDKDSTKQVSAGGLTKYMTLAVLLTNYADQLDNTFQMPFAISDYVYNTNNADMRSNETFTYREAMYAMLTRNANEAAMGVAYALSGGDLDGWVAQMNTLSKRIGTTASSWTDACGIDSGNTTCAVDMYLILRYLMSFDAFVEVSGAPLMIVLHMNAKGLSDVANGRLYASNIVSYIIYGILWCIIIFRGKTFFNKKYWKFSLQLSIPLIGYALAAQVLSVSDRMMISKMVDNSAVGIYSTLYTVSSISLLVWSAINASFIPYLYQNIESDKNEIKKYSLLLMGAYAIVAALLTFFAPEIVRTLATEEYYEAIYIMPPIAGGVFLTCVSNMYSNIMIYYKKTQYIMYASIAAAATNVVLNYFCIAKFGYMAAAYTTLVAYIVLALGEAVCAHVVCKKERGANYEVYNDKAVGLMAVMAILLCLSGLIWYQYAVLRYGIIIAGCAVGAVLGYRVIKMRKVKQ